MSMILKRRRQVFAALGMAAVLLVTGLASTLIKGTEAVFRPPPSTLTPLMPDTTGMVADISVTTSTEAFLLRRSLNGWVLASHDNYDADAERAERLIEAITNLEPVGERTRLASQRERLSLGDPVDGGNAARVIMRDNNQRELANLLIGEQRQDGHIYVRRGDEEQSWLVSGYLPEFARASDWMQLEFLSLGRDAIREACVLPEEGAGYCLQRLSLSSQSFELVSPRGWALVSPGAGDGVATVLGRIRFRDVRPLREVRSPDIAEHRVTTTNGLEVTVSIREDDGRYWAYPVAIAHTDAAREQAIALNERADGFAFEVSDLSVDRLIRPLQEFAVSGISADTP